MIKETKLEQQDIRGIVDQQKHYVGCTCDSRGDYGGITTLWAHNKWNNISEHIHQHWIRTVLENKIDNQTVVIYNVYAPNQYKEKESCWDDLKASINGETTINIIVAGDFNLILHANDKRGGCFLPDPFKGRLEAIIRDHEFVDVVPKNRRYTWSNHRLGTSNIVEWLDKFLINVSFLSSFLAGHANILSSST